MDSKQFALDLFNAGAIKFGEFKLKSGILSPLYVDLRILIAYPSLIERVCKHVTKNVMPTMKFDSICGVPYTAIPFASCASIQTKIPMLMKRKEAKAHGTKQMIEGKVIPGQTSLIFEDIVSSGTSILETVISLKKAGLRITDTIVVLDREQGGIENLEKLGIHVYALLNITQVLKALSEENLIEPAKVEETLQWLKNNKAPLATSLIEQLTGETPKSELIKPISSIKKRFSYAKNEIMKRVFQLIVQKKSNLCVSLDETKSADILKLMDQLGSHVVIFKLHCDIIDDFNDEFVQNMQKLAIKHDFIIFEDRKLADIGNTVRLQFSQGLHHISSWADIVNCHAISGPSVIHGIRKGASRPLGLLLVAQLSCANNLIDDEYTKKVVKMAMAEDDLVIGFISQTRLDDNLLHMTPGVHLTSSGDALGQQYISPRQAVLDRGTDVIIVGRGITAAADPLTTAIQYKQAAYEALLERDAQT